ncbi:MAG: hypothetical protein CM15mP91_0510 [Chloroflexota bacterium]|nr:MAG: hypothetical protein CM15mP91_0510 [Chloroflexota bacterium]
MATKKEQKRAVGKNRSWETTEGAVELLIDHDESYGANR